MDKSINADGVALYINNEGTSAWSKLATADNIGDMTIDGKSLKDSVIRVDKLETRLGDLECFSGLDVSIANLERGLENLQNSFRALENRLKYQVEEDVVRNKMDIKALDERCQFLDSRDSYLDSRINLSFREIGELKEKGNEKMGVDYFFDFPDYFEKMNFKNRAIKLNRMALNTVMKGTM